jgi:hypothetical protein
MSFNFSINFVIKICFTRLLLFAATIQTIVAVTALHIMTSKVFVLLLKLNSLSTWHQVYNLLVDFALLSLFLYQFVFFVEYIILF